MRKPILDSIKTINSFGIEVVSGIILGLDSDTPSTADNILSFISESKIPMLTINLLYALPRTKLHERLKADGRLVDDPGRESNVLFKMPHNEVVAMWRRIINEAYSPRNLLERFDAQTRICFPNRLKPKRKVTPGMVAFGVQVIARTLWQVGVRADYRDEFWRIAKPLLKQGRIEEVIHIGVVSHHLISFTRDCATGTGEACFYADPSRGAEAGKLVRA